MSSDTSSAEDRTVSQSPSGTSGEAETMSAMDTPPDDATQLGDETGTAQGARSVDVAMVTTPGDGTCGIGTYARDLLDGFDGGRTRTIPIDQHAQTVRHFLALAARSILADGDVVHVQHEYGLFRRDGSQYPGLFAAVFFPVLFALNAMRGKRIVVTFHSVLRPDPEAAPFRVRLFLLLSHKLIATSADHLVFLAAECADRFTDDVALDPEQYSLLPHGVNMRRSTDVTTAAAKREFGYDPEDTVIGIPGFIRPPKGHDVFVEVARQCPEYEFLIAGGARPGGADFDYAAEIESSAPENVTITGVLDDDRFPIALAAQDLALLPYRVVTQSGTFNWCAAQELPILASDEPYFERLRREWDALETVSVDDPAVVAECVRSLIQDETRREMLRRQIRRYKVANSFEQVAKDHHRIYRRLLDDRPPEGTETARTESSREATMLAACSAQREPSALSTESA